MRRWRRWKAFLFFLGMFSSQLFSSPDRAALLCPEKWGDLSLRSVDFSDLKSLWQQHQSSRSECKMMVGWELALRWGLQNHEEEKTKILEDLEQDCAVPVETLSERLRVGCALVLAERLRQPMLWNYPEFARWRQFTQNLSPAFSGQNVSKPESLWIAAHLERTAPLLLRPDWRAALVAQEWLVRASPSAWNQWWRADTFYAQGNSEKGRQAEALARVSSDIEASIPRSRWQKPADGRCNGWMPRLGYNPYAGLIVGAGYCQQNSHGAFRSLQTSVQGSTRGNFSLSGSMWEAWHDTPLRSALSVVASRHQEDFFGKGWLTQSEANTWTTEGVDFQVQTDLAFGRDAWGSAGGTGSTGGTLSLAYQGRLVRSRDLPSVLPAPFESFHGPAIGVAWDELDSDFHPKSGWKLRAHQMLGLRPQLFSRLELQAILVLPWSVSLRSRLEGQAITHFGRVPYPSYAVLSKNLMVPAVWPYRFVDEEFWFATLQQEWDVWRSFTVAPAFSAGADAAGNFRTGVALSGVWFFSRDRRWSSRLEAGVFAGQWAVQGGVSIIP